MRMSCIYGPRQMGTEDQGWVAHFLLRALRDEPSLFTATATKFATFCSWTTRSAPISRYGAIFTIRAVAPMISAGSRQRHQFENAGGLHRGPDRSQSQNQSSGLAARRSAILCVGHPACGA